MENEKEQQNERKNIKGGILLTYLRLAIYVVISIFYPPYLLRSVGSDNNGLYGFAMSVIAYVLLLSLGVENSYVRFATVSEQKEGEEGLKKTNGVYLKTYGFIAALQLAAGLVLAALYGFGAVSFQGATPESQKLLGELLLVVAIGSSFDFFLSLFTTFSYYKSRFIWAQIFYLLIHLLTTGGCLLALYLGRGILWVAIITVAVQLVMDGVMAFFCLKNLKMSFAFPKKADYRAILKEIILFSLPIFMVIIVSQVNANFGKTILGQMVSMTAVTVFSYGIQFYTYENLISTAISSNFSPKINRLVVEGKPEEVSRLFLKISEMQLIVLFLIVGGFMSCGHQFIYAWLGDSELTTTNLDQVFYISAGFLALWVIPFAQELGIEVQRANNKHRFLSIVNLALIIVNIGVSLLCIVYLPSDAKVYGPLIGLGCSTIAGMVVASDIYYAKELHLPIGRFYVHFIKIGVVAGAAWVITYVLYRYAIHLPDNMNLWLVTVIRGATFVLLDVPAIGLLYRQQIKDSIHHEKGQDKAA
jgi:O-antigen/teichoic acid export membrane protein